MNAPTCKHLRTKKMYIPALASADAAEPEQQAASACHYWCNCTLTEVGLDDQPVHRERCQPARTCFEP